MLSNHLLQSLLALVPQLLWSHVRDRIDGLPNVGPQPDWEPSKTWSQGQSGLLEEPVEEPGRGAEEIG